MALQDMNNDKVTDLITINSDSTAITVYYFDQGTNKYTTTSEFQVTTSGTIQSVVPTKTQNYLQGLMVVVKDNDTTSIQWYTQSETSWGYKFLPQTTSDLQGLQIMTDTQPIMLDLNGDQIMDIMYQPSTTAHFKDLTVALGTEDPDVYNFSDFFGTFVMESSDFCGEPNSSDQLSTPHSSTFIDFDGDCKPDLMLTRSDGSYPYLEIYIQKQVDGKQMYCLSKGQGKTYLSDSKTMPMVELADFNRDGMFDLIYARPSTNEIVVLHNKLTARGAKSDQLCKPNSNSVS